MKKIIFISQPLSSRLPGIKKNEFDFYKFIFNFQNSYNFKIIICLHPEEKKNLKKIAKIYNTKNIKIIIGTKKVFKEKSDFVVGMFSTERIRACLLGKIIINFFVNKEISKNFILKRLGISHEVSSSEQMYQIIKSKRIKKIKKKELLKKFYFLKGSSKKLINTLN